MPLGLYALVGLSSAIAGTVLLLGRPQSHYAAFAVALVAGGSALFWLGVSRRRVGRAGWLACGALAVAGFFGSLLIVREELACMFCYHRGQGYPWAWLDIGFTHPDMPTLGRAHEIMASSPDVATRSVDWLKVLLDGIFWWYIALPLVVVTTQVNRVLRQQPHVASLSSKRCSPVATDAWSMMDSEGAGEVRPCIPTRHSISYVSLSGMNG